MNNIVRISLVFLGQTGAGPVYSLEMAKALALSNECELQVIVSEDVSNIEAWKKTFLEEYSKVRFIAVKTYKHTNLSVFFQFFNYYRKSRVVRLINEFSPDVLYVPFGLMWSRFIYFFIPRKTKIIYTIHDVQAHDKFNLGEVVSKCLIWGSKLMIDGYVILNEKERKIVCDKYHKPTVVIPHASFSYYFVNRGCDEQRINYRIGFFGRIEPYKGLDLLVDAFEKTSVSGLRLLIAGSGNIDSELLERINNNNRIELINRYIRDDEFQPLLDTVDFVVLPYKRASQSGVIPMCFAYGKTVIATDVGALKEQVPENTGIITPIDSKDISSTIEFLYTNSDIIFQYGRNAKDYAERELSWTKSAQLLIDFINKL